MEKLCFNVVVEHFKRGDTIIRQGDVGTSFYLMNEGECCVRKKSETTTDGGDKECGDIVGMLRMGDCFGERSLMSNEVRAATIQAVSKVTCLVIQKQVGKIKGLKIIINRTNNVENRYLKRCSLTLATCWRDTPVLQQNLVL